MKKGTFGFVFVAVLLFGSSVFAEVSNGGFIRENPFISKNGVHIRVTSETVRINFYENNRLRMVFLHYRTNRSQNYNRLMVFSANSYIIIRINQDRVVRVITSGGIDEVCSQTDSSDLCRRGLRIFQSWSQRICLKRIVREVLEEEYLP